MAQGQLWPDHAANCLVDRQPREIGDDDMAKMLELACMAERELNPIELVRAQKELIETQQDLVSAQEMLALPGTPHGTCADVEHRVAPQQGASTVHLESDLAKDAPQSWRPWFGKAP